MKVIVVITILFASLLFPTTALAQTGTCRDVPSATNPDGFVNWKECLEGNQTPSTWTSITTPVFINNAYQQFYDDSLNGAYCFRTNTISPVTLLAKKDCATTRVLNRFALDIFSVALAIMFLIFCFLIFRSRIMYITAGDNEEQVKKSKKMATAAFIGFLMIFLGLIIAQILALSIGSNLSEFKLFG